MAPAGHESRGLSHRRPGIPIALAQRAGADSSSIELPLSAADDERRHAAITDHLARRMGATPRRPTIAASAPRGLLDLAVANAVEGCVAETWAALVNTHQARSATDPEVRALYAENAADAAHHAELAWAIHTWLMGQLDRADRERVLAARRNAVDALAATLAAADDDPALVDLGVPRGEAAARLHRGLAAALWAA